MIHNRKLIIDTFSEVYNLLKSEIDEEFWDFNSCADVPRAIYVFGRQQFIEHKQRIINMAESGNYTIIFCNAAEGSWTLQSQLQMLGIEQLIIDQKILLISGGEQQAEYSYIRHDHFLTEILNYEENHLATTRTEEIFNRLHKPYKFLFLNGRARPHRKYLYEKFKSLGILDQSLWTMLDSRPSISRGFVLNSDNINLMATESELKWLPAEYEIVQYQNPVISPGPATRTFVKHELFKNEWGEIYIKPEPYIDTYFSLITETVVEQPWPFRTEKIAKPLMIGHPFIVATSPGYYQDLHRLGFKTFGHLIDESFDTIENHQDRMDRIVDIVKDLCQQDLDQFLVECYNVCKYNQQHLAESNLKSRQEFPARFIQFIQQHTNE